MEKFKEFYNRFKVASKDPFTHTSKHPIARSYYLKNNEETTFLTMYQNIVSTGTVLGFTEKPDKFGPLRLDFDMKSSIEEGTYRRYTHSHIKKLVNMIQEILINACESKQHEDSIFNCLVLEKSKPRNEDGVVKDGFHLHFPNFICEGWFQDEYLRETVTEKMISENLWTDEQGKGLGYSTKIESFIDGNMAVKCWLMYGSSKLDGLEPFLASIAFNGSGDQITFDELFQDEMIGRNNSVKYYLPSFLSIKNKTQAQSILIKSTISPRKVKPKRKSLNVNRKREEKDIFEDLKTISDGNIMEMISSDRAEDYSSWIDIGWILFNIGEGCDEAFQVWNEFSQRSAKYTPGVCEDYWSRMEMKGKTIGSLLAIAKHDSPDDFRDWKKRQVNFHLYKSLGEAKPNESDMAEVISHLFKDKFICADAKKDLWFEFKNHKWTEMDDALSLKKLFCTDVKELFYALKEEIVKKQRQIDDDAERMRLELLEKKCMQMTTALKTVGFHDKLMKMCKMYFHSPNFLKYRDENRQLFGCENGVLDLSTGLFREGRPDDNITLSCGVVYNKHYKYEDEDIQDVHDFLNKIFPNPNLKKYFIDSTCSCLEGGNKNKIFITHTGEPDGGKSMTMAFVEKTFGDYCVKFPRELFINSGKNSSGGARPELSRVRGKRIGMGQEVAKNETFNIGVIKELTGNDSFFARGLFEKGSDINPMFTLMMQCNEPPKVPGNDEATWARIRLLPYESKFVKTRELKNFPVPDSEEERVKMKRWKADPNIADRLEELRPALLWILFNRYPEYKKQGGIKDPEEVTMATSNYRQLNDTFSQFSKERLEKVDVSLYTEENKEDIPFLKVSELYLEFGEWFKENNPSYTKEKLTRIQITHEFSKKLGVPVKKGNCTGWAGYKIIFDEEDKPKQKSSFTISVEK